MVTLVSQFLVKLPILVSGIVSLSSLPFGEQMFLTMLDSVAIAVILILLEFYEITVLDKIMKTVNSAGQKERKSKAAWASSSEDDKIGLLSSDSEENEEEEEDDDDGVDWRLSLKLVDGNPNLFKHTELQTRLNELEKKLDLKCCESCIEFNTGTEHVEDDRLCNSYPTSPRMLREFDGIDLGNFGKTFDNCYAEAKEHKEKGDKAYSEMGTQA